MLDDPFRILITGWRYWPADLAWFVEMKLRESIGGRPSRNEPTILVHGACPVGDGGVDGIAERYITGPYRHLVTTEPHPADFAGRGPKAGPERNQRMVDRGAGVCLGFPGPDSRGTWDCLKRAAEAGIECRVFSLAYAQSLPRPE